MIFTEESGNISSVFVRLSLNILSVCAITVRSTQFTREPCQRDVSDMLRSDVVLKRAAGGNRSANWIEL